MAKSYVVKWVLIHGNNVWKSQQQFFNHENLLEILKQHAKVHFWYIQRRTTVDLYRCPAVLAVTRAVLKIGLIEVEPALTYLKRPLVYADRLLRKVKPLHPYSTALRTFILTPPHLIKCLLLQYITSPQFKIFNKQPKSPKKLPLNLAKFKVYVLQL